MHPELGRTVKSLSEEAERVASHEIRAGFSSREEVVERVLDTLEIVSTAGGSSFSNEDAQNLTSRLWDQQLKIQEGWPEETDADRLERAFAALEAKNILTRMNFGCCLSCGVSELWGDSQEEDKGYAFFHGQDMTRVIENGELKIAFGSFSKSDSRDMEVGKAVVRQLKKARFNVNWSKDAKERISVEMQWRRRLPIEDNEELD